MNISGKIIVVTGAASGIGRALCQRFAREGAAGIVAADLNAQGAAATAKEVGGSAFTANVTVKEEVQALVDHALKTHGRIDLFCSNAGVSMGRGETAPAEAWQTSWNVHVMAHVYAAEAVLPHMLARGQGYLLHTASAAGLPPLLYARRHRHHTRRHPDGSDDPPQHPRRVRHRRHRQHMPDSPTPMPSVRSVRLGIVPMNISKN